MPRRLFADDDPAPEEGRLLVEGVPPLGRELGYCNLAVCLQAALGATGQDVGYPWLMGSLGAAFLLRVEGGFGAELAVVDRWRHVTEALGALGRQATVVEVTEEAAARALIEAELAAGRPVLAKGWGDWPLDWAIVVGRKGEGLLGRWPGGGHGLRRAGPAMELLLTVGEASAPAEASPAAAAALERALPLLDESAGAYATWQELLAGDEPYGPPLQQRDRMVAEQWLGQCLVDARWAGQEFLRAAAGHFAELTEEALLQAADLMAEIAADLEQLITAPDAPAATQLAADPEWRAGRIGILAQVAAAEARLRARLARALDEDGLGG